MAECNDLFLKFDGEIKLSSEKKEILRISRENIRDDIRSHFSNVLGLKKPEFFGQGSYMMNTIIKPIDGEYDIDNGVYLTHIDENEEYPDTKKVHKWVKDAVENITKTAPEDKNTCVRVIYKNDYHVDLPIYIKLKNMEHPVLAHKTDGWIDSDPKIFTDWFSEKVKKTDPQLKRIVRYFKAWKDFQAGNDKFPSGMIFTILAAENYHNTFLEDDKAFLDVAKNIKTTLDINFKLKKPVFPEEELLSEWKDNEKEVFLNKLSELISLGTESMATSSVNLASVYWRKVFGDRFPAGKINDDEIENYTSPRNNDAPSILGNYGRSS